MKSGITVLKEDDLKQVDGGNIILVLHSLNNVQRIRDAYQKGYEIGKAIRSLF